MVEALSSSIEGSPEFAIIAAPTQA
jgi:hypothetical protein